MKKIILALVLLVQPLVAAAQDQRELLLTGEGTLYIAERRYANDHPDDSVSSVSYIALSVREGETVRELIVPGTVADGTHASPALAFDAPSRTLFVFWQRSGSLLHSELLFQSLSADGQWSPVSSFGSVSNMRENFSIAVTRKSEFLAENGTTTSIPEINVHAVWWETDTYDGLQSANYAMLTIENGSVADITIQKLSDFAQSDAPAADPDALVPDVLKHPAVTVAAQQDEVNVIYGDVRSGSLERVSIKPRKVIAEARVHIPVGRHGGKIGAPRLVTDSADARVTTLANANGRIAVYTTGDKVVRYSLYADAQWSDARELRLDENLTRETAIQAVRRLVDHE